MLKGLRKLFGFETRDSLAAPSSVLLEMFARGACLVASPERSPTASAAVRTIAEAVGIPFHVYRRQSDGSRERDASHPAAALLAGDANPWTGSSQLRVQVQSDALLNTRGGFAKIVRVNGQVRELHRLPPLSVTPEINSAGEPAYRVRNVSGGDVVLAYTDVMHISTPGSTLDRPFCCADMASTAIAIDVAMANHQRQLFERGARPAGLLKIKRPLGDEAFQVLSESWNAAFGGGENSGKTAILENGDLEFQPLTFSSADAQFVELRRLAIEEIARAFRVPSTLLNILDRATWRNVEELGTQFLSMCLLPWLEVWQAALDRALFTPDERKTYFVEACVDDLLRADIAARYAALRSAVGSSWLTPNEARRLDNLPPVDGGDELVRQAGQSGATDNSNSNDQIRIAA